MINHLTFVSKGLGTFSGYFIEKREGMAIVRVAKPNDELRSRHIGEGDDIALTTGCYEVKEG